MLTCRARRARCCCAAASSGGREPASSTHNAPTVAPEAAWTATAARKRTPVPAGAGASSPPRRRASGAAESGTCSTSPAGSVMACEGPVASERAQTPRASLASLQKCVPGNTGSSLPRPHPGAAAPAERPRPPRWCTPGGGGGGPRSCAHAAVGVSEPPRRRAPSATRTSAQRPACRTLQLPAARVRRPGVSGPGERTHERSTTQRGTRFCAPAPAGEARACARSSSSARAGVSSTPYACSSCALRSCSPTGAAREREGIAWPLHLLACRGAHNGAALDARRGCDLPGSVRAAYVHYLNE